MEAPLGHVSGLTLGVLQVSKETEHMPTSWRKGLHVTQTVDEHKALVHFAEAHEMPLDNPGSPGQSQSRTSTTAQFLIGAGIKRECHETLLSTWHLRQQLL